MPVEIIKYSEQGDVRSRKEEFCFGTRDRGETFVDSEKKLGTILEKMSKKLNLIRHSVQAFKDLNSKLIWGSADMKVFKAEDGTYYAMNFWRLMPPEFPNMAAHLNSAPREMSMFYRFLRPEFVRAFPQGLSPDANLLLTRDTLDWETQTQGIQDATYILLNDTIMKFANYLSKHPVTAPAWQGYGIDLTANLHRYGINIRHLGKSRKLPTNKAYRKKRGHRLLSCMASHHLYQRLWYFVAFD